MKKLWLFYTHLLMVCGIAATREAHVHFHNLFNHYLFNDYSKHILSHCANIVYRLMSPRYI